MSKKSSTFVAGFNSGAHDIKSYNVIMENQDFCKAQINNTIYRVRRYVLEDGRTDHFAVLNGRRLCKGGAWFNNERSAVLFMLRTAFEDVVQTSIYFES